MAKLTPDATRTEHGLVINEKIIPWGAVWPKDSGAYKKGAQYKADRLLSGGTGKVKGVTIHNTNDLKNVEEDAEQYDGKAFFATDHPVGKDKASNKGTAKLSMGAYKTARTSMMSLKNSKGRPLALVPDLLVVPPALEADARDILVADFINGTKNTMQGTAEIHVEPRLASDSAWFLLCTKRPVKPLIYQQRKKAKFVSKTNETDDNVFMSKKFIYGADSRGNAGFGFWQMAYGSDGTTT